ncbi:FUSC family protein [Acetobacteraceae bacterium KSS8]|uniref:FUSC family protein n=1 Tax=Endosaccharibacter trunci TaxID=2812733 RepID=A0ABT1WA07_9PROT|nr:FUSC family protein [Acetobacteraceae bacterium KSS8]
MPTTQAVQATTDRPGPIRRSLQALRNSGPEMRQTVRMLVSVFLSDVVAHLAGLNEPYWALITAVIVTQAKVSATLEAGRDQIVGTLVGALFGAGAIALALLGLPRMPVFALLLVPLAIMAAFKPNLRLASVTLVVVFLFPTTANDPFSRPIDRTLAILVGAAVSLLVSFLVFHSRSRTQVFRSAAAMLDTMRATQAAVLHARIPIAEVEHLNDATSEVLKTLVTAIVDARRERLGALDQHEPLMVRLVPMLRRLQSDVLFVARGLDETLTDAGPDAQPLPELAAISDAIGAVMDALRQAMDQEAETKRHASGLGCAQIVALSSLLEALGDRAGPLPRFTLEMLLRDLLDMVQALDPDAKLDLPARAPSRRANAIAPEPAP